MSCQRNFLVKNIFAESMPNEPMKKIQIETTDSMGDCKENYRQLIVDKRQLKEQPQTGKIGKNMLAVITNA